MRCSHQVLGGAQVLPGFFFLLLRIASAYNHPDCDSWPSHEQWVNDLGRVLSDPSFLHGPFTENPGELYAENCYGSENFLIDDLEWISQGHGLCQYTNKCAAVDCDLNNSKESNLPAYTVEAHTISDIQRALEFANTHNIAVAVKSTGHSYAGQSTYPNSLLIWMRHFSYDEEQEDGIIENYETCDGSEIIPAVLQIRGGATFLEAMKYVGDDYHILSGECPTVSLSGGWLMGGGLSYTAQKYGLGIENVQEMTVILANGDIKTVNACSSSTHPDEPDLWYALRGGGGGAFGIVISIKYRLHEPTAVCELDVNFSPNLVSTVFPSDEQRRIETAWLDFFYSRIAKLDRRWGGAHGISGARMYFVGTAKEAKESEFLRDMEIWYDSVLTTATFNPAENGIERPSEYLTEFDSWKDVIVSAPENQSSGFQASIDVFGDAMWIVPQQMFVDDYEAVRDVILDVADIGAINRVTLRQATGYILGGAPLDDQSDTTVVRPLRTGLLAYAASGRGLEKLIEFAPPEKGGGFSFNHMYAKSPNYIEYFWGNEHYAKLLAIKEEVDPDHRFNVYQGVGYRENVAPSCDDPSSSELGWLWTIRSIFAYLGGFLVLLKNEFI